MIKIRKIKKLDTSNLCSGCQGEEKMLVEPEEFQKIKCEETCGRQCQTAI
jgi:hypothetical protein